MSDPEEPEAEDPYLGRVLDGRYQLLRRLGRGGMGSVYEAEHTTIGRRLAIKILFMHLASDADAVRRFKNEARASGTLGHPNIVESVDFGRTRDGAPYIAMELLSGRSLADAVREDGPFAIDRAVRVVDSIAAALSAAHDKGIYHRDIKPENVFLCGEEERVKVLDFGISKFAQGGVSVATQTGAIMGSPRYMAPEQLTDSSSTDARTDVYQLGAVLFELLTTRLPFEQNTLPALYVAIAQTDPPSVGDTRADVPEALASLVASMLGKSPDDRPQSMAEVRERIAAFSSLSGPPRLSAPAPAPSATEATPFATEMADTGVELPMRSTGARLLLGLVAVLLFVGGAAWLSADDQASPAASPAAAVPVAMPAASEEAEPVAPPAASEPAQPAAEEEPPASPPHVAPMDRVEAPDAPASPAMETATRMDGRHRAVAMRTALPMEEPTPVTTMAPEPTMEIDGVPFEADY